MDYVAPVKWSWRLLKSCIWSLVDALPPYRKVEGLLESKETGPDGKLYLHVGHAKVVVDRATYNVLTIGESLRVRYTRGQRAINIDRLMPGKGPG